MVSSEWVGSHWSRRDCQHRCRNAGWTSIAGSSLTDVEIDVPTWCASWDSALPSLRSVRHSSLAEPEISSTCGACQTMILSGLNVGCLLPCWLSPAPPWRLEVSKKRLPVQGEAILLDNTWSYWNQGTSSTSIWEMFDFQIIFNLSQSYPPSPCFRGLPGCVTV